MTAKQLLGTIWGAALVAMMYTGIGLKEPKSMYNAVTEIQGRMVAHQLINRIHKGNRYVQARP